MNSSTGEKKVKLSKIIIFCVTIILAVLIVSFTVGKEFYEGKSDSMFSFGAVHFAGYLFFLLMPVEAAFVYYLSFYEESKLIAIALGTAFVAQLIDYLIGYSFSLKFIRNFVGEKRLIKAEKHIRKYGNLTIFIFNLFPLSSPVIALVAGMLKYKLRDLIVFSLIGLILKYVILSLIF
ncbi:DedA family protein [Maribellus maritimus]|uniref:DedA family protein n=1 Tax=Maribellus maritimus TaxID=2870838 RepID=UPI001EEA6D07|nr:VTT domain-containing protein [Maribellus maritimus]MCG6185762.1 VTT domain-containing protein [Maribellus maritimus]